MKTSDYHVFKMEMTKEEFETIKTFCNCLHSHIYANEDVDIDDIIDLIHDIIYSSTLENEYIKIEIVD